MDHGCFDRFCRGLPRLLAVVSGLVACVLVGVAQGQNAGCPHAPWEYRVTVGSDVFGWSTDSAAVAQQAVDSCLAKWNAKQACDGHQPGSSGTTVYEARVVSWRGDWAAVNYERRSSYNGGAFTAWNADTFAGLRRSTVTCPPPPAPKCGDGDEGKGFSTRSSDIEAELGAMTCFDGCKVSGYNVDWPAMNKEVSASGHDTWWFTGWIKFSGEECPTGGDSYEPNEQEPAPEADPIPKPDPEKCAVSDGGTTVCLDEDYGENCGYLNGQYTCLEKTDPDKCWVNDDGSRWCAEKAPTPPKPDNGTPGVKAEPVDKLLICKDGVCKEYDYHSVDQVNGSSRPPGNDGKNPADPTSSDPRTGGGGGGGGGVDWTKDDKVSGGGDCQTPPVCSGDPIACAVLTQSYKNRCVPQPTDADLQAAFGPVQKEDGSLFGTEERNVGSLDQQGWMGGGQCIDDYDLNMGPLLGTYTIPFSELCQLLLFVGMFIKVAAFVSAGRIIVGGL